MRKIFGLMMMIALVLVSFGCQNQAPVATATYSVVYDGNGSTTGTVPVDSNKHEANASVTVLPCTLTKTDYSFVAWNTKADGTGTMYNSSATFAMPANDVTLYAQWSKVQKYTVTYQGNENTSGSVPVDTGSYAAGTVVTILGNTNGLVKTGYSFANWNTSANGSGTSYAVGSTLSMPSSDVVLYAQWSLIPTYNIVYNVNGGDASSVPSDSNNYISGDTITVSSTTPTRSGYAFDGWTVSSDGTGTIYKAGDKITVGSQGITLYAKWGKLFSVIYDVNGGDTSSAPIDSEKHTENSSAVVLSAVPTKTDNFFIGWTVASDNSGTVLKSGDSIAISNANVTLYAKWATKKVSFKIVPLETTPAPFGDDYDSAKVTGTFVGYGDVKTSGYFVYTYKDGTVYTGTYAPSTGPYALSGSTSVSTYTRQYYKLTFANGETVDSMEVRRYYKKTTGALSSIWSGNYGFVASSDAMTALMESFYDRYTACLVAYTEF